MKNEDWKNFWKDFWKLEKFFLLVCFIAGLLLLPIISIGPISNAFYMTGLNVYIIVGLIIIGLMVLLTLINLILTLTIKD
jgi:hypothetical protein